MQASYDPEADCAYVRVQPPSKYTAGCSKRTDDAEDGTILDYDSEGDLLGYELISIRVRGLDAFAVVPEAARRLVSRAMALAAERHGYVRVSDDGSVEQP
jgi:uncharacterized protein YuzE